ncbi:hypothetical protein L228DRAFT_243973 [Xylona heveae TC161]|uniref:SigF-like NTF2-like domain-containing protein n=1 Tax=Xylona heveae (strain CBS 132557 / TC161) TaxID=1328760 RepID=A0A165IP49_XYLHT|nr:hypothetical protein L228DRAFT_243973 [Xylona heveae TC161]KZF25179.1 hypothetical protein L228DRAFT_243973 [Xylona heveae TC161]
MEDPVKEISGVIHLLTQSPPSIQRTTLETYFTKNASFTHPFCRTGSFDNSRWYVWMVYRWYKIMSPRIELEIKSVAFDENTLQLYVQIFQVFRIWIIPFHSSPVNLVTVLQLEYNKSLQKYLIRSQNDLYQVNEFVRFIWPGGYLFVLLWQFFSTLVCTIGALALWPVSWFEQHVLTNEDQLYSS